MAGINHHLVATNRHHRQAARRQGYRGRRKRGGEQGSSNHLGLQPRDQPCGGIKVALPQGQDWAISLTIAEAPTETLGEALELHPPAIPGCAHEPKLLGIQFDTWGKFDHQAGGVGRRSTNANFPHR